MDFNSLEKLWQGQTVTGTPPPTAALIADLQRDVHSAQRRFRGAIVIAVSLLVLEWLGALAAHFTALKLLTPVAILAHLVFSALYVALLLRALHSAAMARREIAHLGAPLPASLAATLRTLDLQLQNARLAAVAIPVVVAIAASLFLVKFFAGEIPARGATIGCVFVVILGALIGAAIWHRARTVLRPRRAELHALLHSLAAAPTDQSG